MKLQSSDWLVIAVYLAVVYLIALRAGRYIRSRESLGDMGPVEAHYLAGRSIRFAQGFLSIIATEFSALAFFAIPALVYVENFNYLRFAIGACISRLAIAYFVLPRIYGRGITMIEILTRGMGYPDRSARSARAERYLALFYITTKTVSVSAKLLGGATILAMLLPISSSTLVGVIAGMTYLYVVLGGLKAVVLTDMLQAAIFVAGGVIAHVELGQIGSESWFELVTYAIAEGKFRPFVEGGGSAFLLGLVAGFAYDASTHGVDQEFSQKLLGAPNLRTARRSVAWSAVGSLVVNFLFLSLGAVIWAYHARQGLPVPAVDEIFPTLIQDHFPTPLRGLMIAAILAACMSTLDSSINALSACLVNDVMRIDRASMFKLVVHIDNLIITLLIIIVARVLAFDDRLGAYGSYFAYLSTAPLLAMYVCGWVMPRRISVAYSPSLVIFAIATCFWGMLLNRVTFGLPPQLTILSGIATTIVFLGLYAQIVRWVVGRGEESP